MTKEFDKYEDIYARLKYCFDISFGDGKKSGIIPMNEVRKLVNMRRKQDYANNLPENSLIEIPEKIFKSLKETYISRDISCVSGKIGCAETEAEQLDGITNMSLLMYLSNHLSKQFKFRAKNEIDKEKKEKCKKKEKVLLSWKDMALVDIIASIYVLSRTSEEYENFFSYGNRTDDRDKSTFVIDLPYVGQICVHFGWKEKRQIILENAKNVTKSILEEKVKMGQIDLEQLEAINKDIEENGILPEYEGKLYEYVGAMPIEYIGQKIKEARKTIANKLPENITSEDIQIMKQKGLNQRELYYFFIKMGAAKTVLNEISGVPKKITPQMIETATNDLTLNEFNEATKNIKQLAKETKTKTMTNKKTETKIEDNQR